MIWKSYKMKSHAKEGYFIKELQIQKFPFFMIKS